MGVSGQRHTPAALYPRGKDPGTHWTGGWVGPRAGLDAGARKKSSAPVGDRTPIVQPVVRLPELYWLILTCKVYSYGTVKLQASHNVIQEWVHLPKLIAHEDNLTRILVWCFSLKEIILTFTLHYSCIRYCFSFITYVEYLPSYTEFCIKNLKMARAALTRPDRPSGN
jgi:hypothetical protein